MVDWIMKTSISEGKHVIQWTAWTRLDDLDFSDDLALLSHKMKPMKMKTVSVAAAFTAVSLNIHKKRSRILKDNKESINTIMLIGEALEEIESIMYLGSIIDEGGGSNADVKARIGIAKKAFLQLKDRWTSKQLSTNIKVTIFNTNVKTVLSYGAKTSITTTTIIKMIKMKKTNVPEASEVLGLDIHKGKTKVLKYNTENNNPITLDDKTLGDVESFTYLGRIIDESGGSDADVKASISKERAAFLQLKNI
ncbi:unnamed protein product [Schistosoma curassoni]|uniref:DUF6451 domain-containing protein n=1 Tax=Schistosoma curassoni TaxID=6186 RepID=A0A183K1Y5_9TREM|nr:unnamed protein product [Schistosoma curassoni]